MSNKLFDKEDNHICIVSMLEFKGKVLIATRRCLYEFKDDGLHKIQITLAESE